MPSALAAASPDPYPEPDSARRDELLHTAARETGPTGSRTN
ncbi:hypothetical protein [Streptomyces sp. NPDC059943]